MLLAADRLERCNPWVPAWMKRDARTGRVLDPIPDSITASISRGNSQAGVSPTVERTPGDAVPSAPPFASLRRATAPTSSRGFADYLRGLDEFDAAALEYERLFAAGGGGADTLCFLIGESYYHAHDVSRAVTWFQRCGATEGSLAAVGRAWAAAALLSENQPQEALHLIDAHRGAADSASVMLDSLIQGYVLLAAGDLQGAARADVTLRRQADVESSRYESLLADGLHLRRKSSLLSGLLSIVHGLGRAYTGSVATGLYSAGVILATGGLAYRSSRRHDWEDVSTIVYASAAVVFYGGDVLGAVLDAKRYNAHEVDAYKGRVAEQCWEVARRRRPPGLD